MLRPLPHEHVLYRDLRARDREFSVLTVVNNEVSMDIAPPPPFEGDGANSYFSGLGAFWPGCVGRIAVGGGELMCWVAVGGFVLSCSCSVLSNDDGAKAPPPWWRG